MHTHFTWLSSIVVRSVVVVSFSSLIEVMRISWLSLMMMRLRIAVVPWMFLFLISITCVPNWLTMFSSSMVIMRWVMTIVMMRLLLIVIGAVRLLIMVMEPWKPLMAMVVALRVHISFMAMVILRIHMSFMAMVILSLPIMVVGFSMAGV